MFQRTMTGEPGTEVSEKVSDLNLRERIAIAPVAAIIILLGFFPQVVLNVVNPAVDRVMDSISSIDPVATEGANK
jgi:NADH-quinone oxidoreductase subunit M